MKTLIGGAVAILLGVIGLSVWLSEFLQILVGAVPIMLLLGGGLALYLGFDELKDTWKKEEISFDAGGSSSDTEGDKQEIDELEHETEALKTDKE
jgi:hypothetical protein